MVELANPITVEILDPARFFLVKDAENPTVAIGWINDTSAGNFEWWNMWSFTTRWPWIRHYRGFVEASK